MSATRETGIAIYLLSIMTANLFIFYTQNVVVRDGDVLVHSHLNEAIPEQYIFIYFFALLLSDSVVVHVVFVVLPA